MTSGVGKWYTFPSPLRPGMVSGRLANNGLLLRATLPTYLTSYSFASSEAGDAATRPRLVVTYYVPGTATPAPSLVIGHITDIHAGGTGNEAKVAFALQDISRYAQVLVDTGDCTEWGTVGETITYWEWMAANTTIPWRGVQGNHDDPTIYATYVWPLEWSWDVGGYRLIGINWEDINYTALDAALTTEKPCIIFGHLPMSWYGAGDQAALRQRFRAYHVPLYVAGHTHQDSLAVDPESGTVLLVGRYGSLGGYRLITLRGSDVSVTFN